MLDIFRRAALNHWFEITAARLHREGKIKVPMYLSLGTEHIAPSILAGLGEKASEWMWFVQHRCHSIALALGLDPVSLFRELLGREDGCNGGMGGSASISIPGKMFGHSGMLGDQVPIGVGYAHASQRPTVIVMGDAACEEDYVLGALGYAATVKAPVLFIVEDNGLSIQTKTKERRSWDICRVARGFGIKKVWETGDRPLLIKATVEATIARRRLPVMMYVECCRVVDHAGGRARIPDKAWMRYDEEMDKLGEDGERIDQEAQDTMAALAEQALAPMEKQSGIPDTNLVTHGH